MDEQIIEEAPAEPKSSPYTIPGAIIVAGAMVAGAVMYGGGNTARPTEPEYKPAANQQAGAGAALNDEQEEMLVIRGGDYILGNPDAPITMIEFGDYECPFCAKFHADTWPQIVDKYVKTGKVKIIWRHFPLTVIHQNAEPASLAVECAGEQDKFWEYHDLLFASKKLDSASLTAHARTLGLDADQFDLCFSSKKYLEKVQGDFDAGQQLGVSGTPSFFINGELIVGAAPFASFDQSIQKALNQ